MLAFAITVAALPGSVVHTAEVTPRRSNERPVLASPLTQSAGAIYLRVERRAGAAFRLPPPPCWRLTLTT